MAEGGEPWQIMLEDMKDRFRYLRNTEQWSDCTFMVGLKPNQAAIKAHKLILAMVSPVFREMFYGWLSKNNGPMIHIPDVQPDTFKALLQYIYTGHIHIGSFDFAWGLCYGAKKYMLQHVVDECSCYISSVVVPRNVCNAYEFACFFDEETLMNKCIQIISKNTKEVLTDKSFENVELNTLITVCSLDNLDLDSELDLFYAVARYAKARQGTRGCSVDGGPPEKMFKGLELLTSGEKVFLPSVASSSLTGPAAELSRAELGSTPTRLVKLELTADKENVNGKPTIRTAIQKVRFLCLTAQEFAEAGVVGSGLLTEVEFLAVLSNIASRDSSVPMPPGFSNCRERRYPPVESVDLEPNAKARRKPCAECRRGVFATMLGNPAEIVRQLASHDRDTLEYAALAAHHMTCEVEGVSENLAQLVAAGGIPALVVAVYQPWPDVQYRALCALTNIACDVDLAKAIIHDGGVPKLVSLLALDDGVAMQAACALGNIAAGGPTFKDAFLDAGVVPALLTLMKPATPSVPLATYLRAYRIICQDYRLKMFDLVSPALPCIESLLDLTNSSVLAEACWIVFHLATAGYSKPQLPLFTPKLASRITALLQPGAAPPKVQAAALRALAGMLTRPQLVFLCLRAGCSDCLIHFLQCGNPSHVKVAAKAVVYILCTRDYLQEALNKGLLDALGRALNTEGNVECQLHAALAIEDALFLRGSFDLRHVLMGSQAVGPYCKLLAASRSTYFRVLLELTPLLRNNDRQYGDVVLAKLREIGVRQLLINLKLEGGPFHAKASELLRSYFGHHK